MKRTIAFIVVAIVGVAIGFLIAWFVLPMLNQQDSSSDGGEPEILYWVAPMDPNYRRDKPGKSPMGMDLVPVYADSEGTDDKEDVVRIDPRVVQNLGVRTETVKNSPLNRHITTVGYVEYDENALHHLHTRVDGWIEKMSVKTEGDPIAEGQVLFEIYSPTLVNAQEEFLMAQLEGNNSLLAASRDRLQSLGLTEEQIGELEESKSSSQRIRVHAESNGVVGMLGVREGNFVTPATHALSIAQLESVWIVAEVLERQAGYIEVGLNAEFEIDALPGKLFRGQIDYVYPELDPVSRSLRVRITFDSGEDILRPNMFARIRIFAKASESVVNVSSTAVIRGGLADRVVLDDGDGKFRSVPVVIGMEVGDRVQILEGLKAGDRIVTSGQFLIDSESNIEAALARLEEAKAEQEQAAVNAVIRRVDAENSRIRVRHDAIPEWNWMSMTMFLKVADVEMLDGLDSGQEVVLDIAKKPEGGYVVVDIRPRDAESDDSSDSDSP